MKVKIIIPIYNDWQSVFKLFEEIDNLKIDKNFEISIIVVNDASNHDRSNEEVIFDNKFDIDLFTFILAEVPERSKGVDLSSTATASWVRIPPSAFKTSYSKPQKFFF